MSALDEYLNRTVEWMRANNETQLLLSYIQPHKKVVPTTISGWLKIVLKSSDINFSLFTAHSERLATTSMATWQKFYKKDVIPIRVEQSYWNIMTL